MMDEKTINRIIKEQGVPEHIIRHCRMVRHVASGIAFALENRGCRIDRSLVDAAAMLHDISKMESVNNGGDHALMGQRLLEGQGYPRVGAIIGRHVRLGSFDLNEAMVVNYADKRVRHDEVVSLELRFDDLVKRYGVSRQRLEHIERLYQDTLKMQQIILDAAGLDLCALDRRYLVPGDESLDAGYPFL
ncbi:MAG: HDIG domain-containing protein [Thermodesulfobacteriota bacterium]|nr:HDIG domain-containing protein [Thermodesulfobacteriota bacterium]